ncbi:glycosyltransferase [Bacteroides uniformis]|jgi:capsular polysaccharide biosynthesis protein|uniref:glycosyltransferase n=1 Tax=Bacteroides uniformis TaxID=820 RepID=UPI001C37D8EF|nr:glycosyltransferase [Bacteroides uniformis]MBV4215398.1 glycosyltransferase [Bacteroides uniformis]MBV4228913.1 glycosyltransferase [Bacteroides uniformis]MCB7403135.1 glycosyltransferase [Bacteroides uniformis]MCB7414276.1 glycosyltransferase [Bacteroides uniformis]MCS2724670.1 glycosyltransferase [Bacteroides uniformis]
MDPLISIIIPCYNSEGFIAATINMLLQQDISECELILVNDGSKDNTLSILRQYETLHENIRVIDQLNQGVSVARNVGMLAAQGKYIYFLDSDDTLAEGALSHFKQVVMEQLDCQMFLFGYETRRNGRTCKSYVFPSFDGVTFSGYTLQRSFLSKKICCHICSCVYDKTFILENGLALKPGVKIGEDVLFLLQLMFKVNKAYYSKRLSFVYQIRDDSVMQGYKSYSLEQYNSQVEFQNFLIPMANRDESLNKYVNFFLLFSYISNLRHYLHSNFRDNKLNAYFIRDGKIRYKPNFVGSYFYWLVMKVTMFIPIKLILKILKS